MKTITAIGYNIYFTKENYQALNEHLNARNYSKVFILTDENTHNHCFPAFAAQLQTTAPIEVIEIEAGEGNKNIETCAGVWNAMSELGGDRKSLLINLGGGVVTDLGGFVASAFKRGIKFINVPTTLLGMVDASVGGKTGVDLGSLKNQIGVINTPEMVVVNTHFLKTLPEAHIRSGWAEMLKHGLIRDVGYWNRLKNTNNLEIEALDELIYDSIVIKQNIVAQDPEEFSLRKTLNFGHTLGHAIESYFLEHSSTSLLHGEAVAIGMVLVGYLSSQITGFSEDDCSDIKDTILSVYGRKTIDKKIQQPIIDLLIHDKKTEGGNINFVLLNNIGKPRINCRVENSLIFKAFNFYNSTSVESK